MFLHPRQIPQRVCRLMPGGAANIRQELVKLMSQDGVTIRQQANWLQVSETTIKNDRAAIAEATPVGTMDTSRLPKTGNQQVKPGHHSRAFSFLNVCNLWAGVIMADIGFYMRICLYFPERG